MGVGQAGGGRPHQGALALLLVDAGGAAWDKAHSGPPPFSLASADQDGFMHKNSRPAKPGGCLISAGRGASLFLLHCTAFPAIIDLKNKNAAASRCANTWKPAQVLEPPTQRPFGRTAWNMIRHSGLFVKGGFCRCVPVVVSHEEAPLLALCRHCPAQRFCFSPTARGRKPPG